MGVCSTFHGNPPEWYQSYKCEPRGAIRGKIRVFSKVTSICPLGAMNVCECKCCMVIHAKVVEVFHSGPVGGKQALSRILEDSLTEVMRSWAHCISLHFFRLSDQVKGLWGWTCSTGREKSSHNGDGRLIKPAQILSDCKAITACSSFSNGRQECCC